MGIGWGQPFALAASAIAALYGSPAIILYAYLATATLALLVAMIAADMHAAGRVLRLACAVALMFLIVVYLTVWAARIVDPLAWALTAVLAFIAMLMAIPALKRTEARASMLVPAATEG